MLYRGEFRADTRRPAGHRRVYCGYFWTWPDGQNWTVSRWLVTGGLHCGRIASLFAAFTPMVVLPIAGGLDCGGPEAPPAGPLTWLIPLASGARAVDGCIATCPPRHSVSSLLASADA